MHSIKTYIFCIVCLALVSCDSSEDPQYDYTKDTETIGLAVTPQILEFDADKGYQALSFSIGFSTDDLTFMGIDNSSVEDGNGSFIIEPNFNHNECSRQVAVLGYCDLLIQYSPATNADVNGSLKLMFLYNHDMMSQKIKYHKLSFRAVSQSSSVP